MRADLRERRGAEALQIEGGDELLVEAEERGLLHLELHLQVAPEVLDLEVHVADPPLIAPLRRRVELAGEALPERLRVQVDDAVVEAAEGVADPLDVDVAHVDRAVRLDVERPVDVDVAVDLPPDLAAGDRRARRDAELE